MDEKESTDSKFIEEESLYPMYFGVSCAFFVLRHLSVSNSVEKGWHEVHEKVLQGSAQLLAFLIWRVQGRGGGGGGGGVQKQTAELLQKLERTRCEVEELKQIRHEDAKANEKVVSIFAAQEHSWLTEKKKLHQQIRSLMNELRAAEKNRSEALAQLNEKVKEMEIKERVFEEENLKRMEVEKNLFATESIAEELRENAICRAREHSSELWKHKTAFLELISNHRQLEAEHARTLRQVEAAKEELKSVLEQNEDTVLLVQNLSAEIVIMRKEMEHKDKILSAMVRKLKLDTLQKQILIKDVKLSKTKRTQTETFTRRRREASESRHERQTLRSILDNQLNSDAKELRTNVKEPRPVQRTRSKSADLVVDYGYRELIEESDGFAPLTDHFSQEGNEDTGRIIDFQKLESLVLAEAEKYATVLQQRHHQEIDAFTDQMRLKDEKVKTFRWQLLSNELESRRLRSHVERLNKDIQQLRHDEMKLEALLGKREDEITSLKKQITLRVEYPDSQYIYFNSPQSNLTVAEIDSWSKIKIRKEKSGEKVRKTNTSAVEVSIDEYIEKEETLSPPEMEFVEIETHYQKGNVSPREIDFTQKFAFPIQQSSKTNNSPWNMDLHALGVAYKIKRLRKQVLMLEKLMGKSESGSKTEIDDNEEAETKDFQVLMSLLNKQVSRYFSLQGKIDGLCQRMHVKGGKTQSMENFLEETFHVQRYMVATGQKLMEIQTFLISSIFIGAEEVCNSAGFDDVKFFVDIIKSLFQEVQRGLEVRIARVIGDVEGTLACDQGLRIKQV